MGKFKYVLPVLVVGLILSACPIKEVPQIAEAEQAISAAKAAGAEQYAPTKLKAAEEALAAAKKARQNRNYNEAVAQAELAKKLANEARAEAEAAQRQPAVTEAAPPQPTENAEAAGPACADVLKTVLFDFDRSDIRSEFRGDLDAAAKCLKDNNAKVTVTGYCDPRGTDDYNMALGERRANAVREYLVNSGVSGANISVVSKGESELVDPNCESENCWSAERRGVMSTQ